jgi:sodium transport system ATP-binding protein
MIEVRDLTKSFGRVAAVRNLSLDAPDGAITGLLGPNGAGKTTTLRAMAGLLTPDGGTVRIGRGPAARDLGALLDHRGLYPRLTGREHLEYFGRLRGLAGAALERRLDEVISMLGLGAVAARRAHGFSDGERMKVALGCAIVHAPRHLLLDEPTNGLDVATVRALRRWLQDQRRDGLCIVLSSHVLGEVEHLCDRLVIVRGGAVVAEGELADIRRRAGSETLEDAFVALTAAREGAAC